ncbi:UNVERIFIED_CONTAM: hypothetical protein Cloal_1240 [Acetivibrio alkalicellulosi]
MLYVKYSPPNEKKSKQSNIPDSLVQLLQFVDGTYWREYAGEKLGFYFLGSDLEGYPYYLLSANQIIENSFDKYLQILIDSEYDFINEDTIE